jgi:hypothetical protein
MALRESSIFTSEHGASNFRGLLGDHVHGVFEKVALTRKA